jgi:psp operon transcriptional activator
MTRINTEKIIGQSASWVTALEQVSQLAAIERSVLISGERGTGKELIAERLHYLSPRWDHPLIKINCAAFADSLLESELFGYEPGAFTGASKRHYGYFERAQGGTLFLDELGTLALRVQEKILRVIEYGEFERLGGQKTLHADVRIVGATNVNLKVMAENNQFRYDLLDRLTFDVIHLPPLREREEDIPLLAEYFAIQFCHELGWNLFPGFSHSAFMTLCNHPWYGNVRELKNVVERSVYRWSNENEKIDHIIIDPFSKSGTTTPFVQDPPPRQTETETEIKSFVDAVQAFELSLLKKTLQDTQFHQVNAAKRLGLTYHQFRGLYRKYQLNAVK